MKTWELKAVEKETEPNCWHCGTAIKWVCWVVSSEGERLAVGVQCCENFLSRNQTKTAKDKIGNLKKEEKLRLRIDNGITRAQEKHGPEADSKKSKINIANWMNVIGATWPWIQENYPDYFEARWTK